MTDLEKIDDALVTLYSLRSYLHGESEYRQKQFGITGGDSPLLASVEASIQNLNEVRKSLETND